LERLITMKYNTSISHGIEFNLGNGEYHSLSFSTLPDRLELFVSKEYLFMQLYKDSSFSNSYISFKRKNQSMFSSENKELFKKDKFIDIRNDNFPLIKSMRNTEKNYVGISFYVTNLHETESLDSTFYIDIPNHIRRIYYFDEIFAFQDYINLHSIEEAKRIEYVPSYIFKFDPIRIKDKYENKYPTNINKDVLFKTNKINLNKKLTETFINFNVPQIFKMDDIKGSLRNKKLYYDIVNYFLWNKHPDILINPLLLVKNGLNKNIYINPLLLVKNGLNNNIYINPLLEVKNGMNNNVHINNEWSLLGHNLNELHYIEEYIGFHVDIESKKLIMDEYVQAKINDKYFNYCNSAGISLGTNDLEMNYDGNIISSKLGDSKVYMDNFWILGDIEDNKIELNKYLMSANKDYSRGFEIDSIYLLKSYENLNLSRTDKFLFRIKNKLSKIIEPLLIFRDNIEIYSDSYISLWRPKDELKIDSLYEFAKRIINKVDVHNEMLQLQHAFERNIFTENSISLNLYNKGINFYNTGSLLSKNYDGIQMEDVFRINRITEAIRVNEGDMQLGKAFEGIDLYNYYITFNKGSNGITEEDPVFIDKGQESIFIYEDTFAIDKGAEPIFITYEDLWINENGYASSMNDDYTWIKKSGYASSMNDDYTWIKKSGYASSMNDEYIWIKKDGYASSMNDDYTWIKKDGYASSVNDDYTWIKKDGYASSMNDKYIWIKKSGYNSFIAPENKFVAKNKKDIYVNSYILNVNKDSRGIYFDKNIQIYRNSKGIGFDDKIISIDKNAKEIRIGEKLSKIGEQILISKNSHGIYYDSFISVWKEGYETQFNSLYEFATRIGKKVNVYDEMIRLDHAYERPIFIDPNISLNLYDKGINFYDTGSLLAKNYKGIRMDEVFNINKNAEAISRNEGDIQLGKAFEGIDLYNYYITFNKAPKGITEEDLVFIDKGSESVFLHEDTFVIDKGAEPIFLIQEDTWINKNRHDSSMIYDYTWIRKNMHDSSMIYEYTWVNKNMHDSSMVYEYTWISKNMHDSSIVYEYPWIKKNGYASVITNENQFVAKNGKGIYVNSHILNVDKYSRGICFDKDIHIDRNSKGIGFDDKIISIDKNAKEIGIEENFSISHKGLPINIDENRLTVDYDSKKAVIEKIEFVDIDSKAIELFKQMSVEYYSKGIFLEEEIKFEKHCREIWFDDYCKYFGLIKEEGGAYTDSDIRLKNAIKHGNLDYQGVNLTKKKKDTYLPDEFNFVDVIHYEDPDPDKPQVIMTGKIDELILPHKDYKYSNFIKKLIKADGSIDWTYVKNYDSATGEYTVSMPMENPISIYADIGRDYIDVDVAILEIVIFLVKKVWKDNMYKYIAFSAHDSLKHIMVEVDNLLIDYGLDIKQRKEAVRCMQLFRWYAEMAVLNNCEYLLKFDTAKISVDYYNKDLGDFKDIITFDNMEITDNYIIEPIDERKKCGITFKNNNINPGLPLNLSFRLYNINTSSSISIIDKDGDSRIKTYSQGIHDITEELENKVKVNYVPSEKYQSINIANIVIDNKSIRGFTVKYKGKFGETNAVMQELLDSMLVIGEASDELKERLKDVSPVTVAISTMVKYFDLHHENKLKGKRLITKK